MPPRFSIIVATDTHNGIGVRNTLPWHLPEDLAHFKRITSGHTVIMGRKTFESIGRALPHRRNIVVTRNPAWQHAGALGIDVADSLEAALLLTKTDSLAKTEVFLIGGATLYALALQRNIVDRVFLTKIHRVFECDTFFPALNPVQWQPVCNDGPRQSHLDPTLTYTFMEYRRFQ